MSKVRLWVLGAPDPEMAAIEALLAQCGEQVAHATVGGTRVRPDQAYADACTWHDPDPDSWDEIITIECGPTTRVTQRIDHHRSGDPGHGRPPVEFLAASSIGQVIAALARLGRLPTAWERSDLATMRHPPGHIGLGARPGSRTRSTWVVTTSAFDGRGATLIPDDLVLVAAADHCLAAAYRGECPGVDPDALMRWRVESRAAFQRRDPARLLADVEATRAALQKAPTITLASEPPQPVIVADMRRDTPWPELPEAAAREGIGYVSGPLVGPDGRRKFTCAGTREQVRAWLDWAKAPLIDVYGDPERGFAGGYEP